ncbi:transketolase [Anaerosolibacter carboniphilus]|uniref:Transketolase n=1 Tax=Anaerosolibacter carboniphilus TaxID=1417629 RepID=A0A841KRZ7_9FIRM|nr:1-deoxy-D-xylulose-5-phosphate synthase N-terminal domain-containing protein [Anaerosolibacter carboniphilus]MBB6216151.1 transketolase [Anaerosolibacter carboniphilus]
MVKNKTDERTMLWQQKIYQAAEGIRHRVMEHTIKNNGGYLSQACSAAEIFATLYLNVLNMEMPEKPLMPGSFLGVPGADNPNHLTGTSFHGVKAPEYDRFFLSPTHYSLVLYAALIEAGRMAAGGLAEFNKDGSVVEMIGADHSPGMEIMTGSLGQGISQAAGIAMGRKLKKEAGRVVVFLSDGECQSGQFWEAVQAMSYHKLDNMLAYVDINGYQCDGKTATVMNIEPFDKRLESFGVRVFRIDGHDVEALAALGKLKPDGRPTFILCDTDPCRGVDILKNRIPKLHYVRFNNEEERNLYRTVFQEMVDITRRGGK